jgi:hypothetical protein
MHYQLEPLKEEITQRRALIETGLTGYTYITFETLYGTQHTLANSEIQVFTVFHLKPVLPTTVSILHISGF